MKKTYYAVCLCASLVMGVIGCGMINPEGIKQAEVAEGQDSVVVNAERVQETSLFAYERLINWEYQNRAILPKEVSRAVDAARREFLPNWRASRDALKEYKEARGSNIEDVHRLTAALSVTQSSFLQLTGKTTGEVGEIVAALTQLNEAIQTLKK